MADQAEEFRQSVEGIPAILNLYRKAEGKPLLEPSVSLIAIARERVKYLLQGGFGDSSSLEDTVPLASGSNAVELVRQWPTVRAHAGNYLTPWVRDQQAESLLMGDYSYIGVYGDGLTAAGKFKGVVVVLLSN